MKTGYVVGVVALVVGCHLDNLLNSPAGGGDPPPQGPANGLVLRFTVQPSSTMQDKAITPAVQVSAFDSLGHAATSFTGAIHLAKGTDASASKNAKLGGTTDVAAVAGVATFSDLTIDQPGAGYTLIAAMGTAPPATTSAAFDITSTPPPPPPPPGSLTVTTTTTGSDQDPNGYLATVDGSASQSIATNGSVTFNNLAPGSHTVTLSGVAANCSVSGGSSRTVTITSGATATTAFSVSCAATTGGITVTTTTTGSSLPNGYSVTVDGGAGQAIGINASVTISGLTPGSHAVVLSGVPANCTVANGTSRTVTVTAGGTGSAAFTIGCAAPPPPNHAPVVSVSGGTVVVGVGYGLNASFTDPDNGPWTYTVNWGDGTTDSGTATSPGPISGTHTYLMTGTYQITVTVTDSLRASGSAAAALTVIL